MKEIIETIILNLVDNKEAVEITEKQDEKSVVFEVKVANEDMGKVIGRQGRLAKSIRTVAKSIGAREHKKVSVVRNLKNNRHLALLNFNLNL